MSVYPQARFMLSVNSLEQLPADSGVEVAFAGRSNAGKSSAINAVVERRNLARSGKTPGQTQLVNFFELQAGRRLVDLPGYGYAKVPVALQAHWQELVGGYLQSRASLGGLFLIVDVRRGVNEDDRIILDWAWRRELPAHILLTKSDKLSRNETRETLKKTKAALHSMASAQLFSAMDGQGVEEARGILETFMQKNTPVESEGRTTGAD